MLERERGKDEEGSKRAKISKRTNWVSRDASRIKKKKARNKDRGWKGRCQAAR